MKNSERFQITFLDKEAAAGIDWDKLESLYAAVGWKRPFHKAARLKRSFLRSYSFSIAIHGADPIGCGRTISDGEVHGWVHDLAVHPDFQNQGIGAEIVQKLVGQLKGVRYLGLLCAENNVAFYQKCGFDTGWTAMTMRQKTR